nr:hypothetical protein [uncultured Arsenicibacter sp.]
MSRFTKAFFALSLFLFVVTGVGNIAKAQVDPPTDIGGTSGMIAPNTFSLCAGSPLTLTASCGASPFLYPRWDNGDPTIALTVLPGVNTYDVYCTDELNKSQPVSVTVIGGCVEVCNVTPSASNLQTVGTLGGDKCSIQLSALVSGRHFEFTGPNGYVHSVVYRNCQENITIFAENVKEPGTYTLKIYREEAPQGPIPGRRAAGDGLYYTIEVGGTACPTR